MSVVPIAQAAPRTTFDWVAPDDVTLIWDLILPGLEAVSQHGDHWRTEDVYLSLRQGQAALHLAFVDGQYGGFIVTLPSRGFDGPVLHVWAVYAVPRMRRVHEECFKKLRELADSIKARRITFTSPRKGWERLGEKFGFAPTLTIFECEVD